MRMFTANDARRMITTGACSCISATAVNCDAPAITNTDIAMTS